MKRGGYIQRKKPMRRTGRLRSVSKDKAKAEARHDRDFGDLAKFVRTYRCCVCVSRQQTPTQACHVKSRGAGGHAWLDSGEANLVPMCAKHHDEQHQHGIRTFEAKYGFVLADLAADIGRAFKSQNDLK